MSMHIDVRIPNGDMVTNVPDDTTPEKLKSMLDIKERFIAHLKDREDVKEYVYRLKYTKTDGKKVVEDFLTAGVGHRLTRDEEEWYVNGTYVDQSTIEEWLRQDSNSAWNAAKAQAKQLGQEGNDDFIIALGSVNFQLGTSWNKEHKNTWALLKAGNYPEAAKEVALNSDGSGESEWYNQTKNRVEDFQNAILKLPPKP